MKPLTVGILLFNEVEVLDFAGPFEVFSLAENKQQQKLFKVITITEHNESINARNGLKVIPDATLNSHPALDVLVVPDGYGAEAIEINNPVILAWIKQQSEQVQLLLSVCTGALLLAEVGLLDGKQATTHWMDIERLKRDYLRIEVTATQRYVDASDADLQLITSAGISSGIYASLYVVAKLTHADIALDTAIRMAFDFSLEDDELPRINE